LSDIATIHKQIRDRLSEIDALMKPLRVEYEQLTAAASQMSGNGSHAATARPPAAKRARGARTSGAALKSQSAGAKRGRRTGGGDRPKQTLALITEKPGITVPELAKKMGIGANYLYRVVPALQAAGKITKQGKGYHPVEAAAPPAA